MRRIILAVVSTAAGLVLLLSFKTHSTSAITTPPAAIGSPNNSASESAATPSASSSPAGGSTSSGSGSGSSESTSGAAESRTVTGSAADTIYGPVEVRITVKNGKVTSAEAVEYPENTPRDQQINAFAIPELNQETLTAGSANIDIVSGATYTSNGYVTSLQSALDKAGR
jgi:major membrane immunogen (membrane-anchored lipoprotein)